MFVRSARRSSPLIASLWVAASGGLLAFLSAHGSLGKREAFVGLTLLLLAYSAVEMARVRRLHPRLWMINPIVVCSVLTFGLSYGLSNMLFFFPAEAIQAVGLIPDVTGAMVKMVWLALLGSIGVWVGYWSPIAVWLGRSRYWRAASRLFSGRDSPRKIVVLLLVAVSVVSRLTLIGLGAFGYSSSYERLIALGNITQYLAIGSGLGEVALLVVSLDYFKNVHQEGKLVWLFVLLSIEVAFGILSGFKSAIVMPFVIVGICKYVVSGRLPLRWMVWAVLALAFAYVVVEPFRLIRNEDAGFAGTSVTDIVDAFTASHHESVASQPGGSLWIPVMARSSLTYVGSLGVAFRDEHQQLPEGSPEFLRGLLFTPVYALVPRIIWPTKPSGNIGLWYTRVVMGQDIYSSTDLGPVTYFYFAGGMFGVFAGFFVFGVLYRILYFISFPGDSSPRAVVFIVLLSTITILSGAVAGILIAFIRDVPLVIILQYYLFRRKKLLFEK